MANAREKETCNKGVTSYIEDAVDKNTSGIA